MTDFGGTTWPVAAKDHRCIWCGESIPKGEKHAHYVGKWEGEFQDWRMHGECNEDADANGDIEDGFMPHEHERPRQRDTERTESTPNDVRGSNDDERVTG